MIKKKLTNKKPVAKKRKRSIRKAWKPDIRRTGSYTTITLHFDVGGIKRDERAAKIDHLKAQKAELRQYLQHTIQQWLNDHADDFVVQLTGRGL